MRRPEAEEPISSSSLTAIMIPRTRTTRSFTIASAARVPPFDDALGFSAADSGAVADPDADPGANPDPDPNAVPDPNPNAVPDPDPNAVPSAESEAEAEAEAGAFAGAFAVAESEEADDDDADAADGVDALPDPSEATSSATSSARHFSPRNASSK